VIHEKVLEEELVPDPLDQDIHDALAQAVKDVAEEGEE